MALWHRFVVGTALAVLLGCGSPSPDPPASGHRTGSADAVVSAPVGDAAGVGPPRPPIALPTSIAGTRIPDAAGGSNTEPNARVQTATSTVATPSADAQATIEQAQRAARESWYAAVRESPEVTVRLQALEVWAQQPNEALASMTFALMDEDERVRTRAQELWEQQLTREAAP